MTGPASPASCAARSSSRSSRRDRAVRASASTSPASSPTRMARRWNSCPGTRGPFPHDAEARFQSGVANRRGKPCPEESRGQPRVLLVDDEPDLLELLELTLSRMGLDTTRAETVAEAFALLEAESFDLCLTDMRLPDGAGLRVVEHINQKGLDRPGGGDHRLRQRGKRGRRAQGRRLRLPGEARRARTAARARQAGAQGAGKAAAAIRVQPARRIAGDAARARSDRAAREKPGAGFRQRRIGQRQGTRGPDDPLPAARVPNSRSSPSTAARFPKT